MRQALLLAALAAACVATPATPLRRPVIGAAELPTVAEASGYARTATHAEVLAFVDRLAGASDLVQRFSLGSSGEGQDLAALLIADPPLRSAAEARASGKPLVFLYGNIHAGEVCGKEALLALARELAGGHAVLERVNVVVLPNYNPDGNDRMAPGNRPGQVGPETMGTRANAGGLDLNRDWVKADAAETRAFLRFLDEWDPEVIVDTHTTNGSHHRYTITYQGPKHPAGDPEVIAYVRDRMLPRVGARLRELTGFDSFFYGNFESKHTRWTTYPAEPRYGAAYRGLRNRMTILSEAYAYASFEDRVVGTREFCRAILEYTAENARDIRGLCRAADARATARGGRRGDIDQVALRVEARAFPEQVMVLGFEEYDDAGARVAPGAPKDWECSLENLFVPTLEVELPHGYVFGPEFERVARHLALHGIAVARSRPGLALDLERYTVFDHVRGDRPFEGHNRIEGVRVETSSERAVLIPPGSYLVTTSQPLGALAAYLLEPQATDGLVAWNFFDAEISRIGVPFPVARVRSELPVLQSDAR